MFTDEFFDYALDGAVANAGTASLHTGNPGSTGTNEVSGGGYTRQHHVGLREWRHRRDIQPGHVQRSWGYHGVLRGTVGWCHVSWLSTLESPGDVLQPGNAEVTTLHIYADNP